MDINRRMTTSQKMGPTSLVTVIPWELRRAWNLKPQDPLIWYLIEDFAVLVPLAYLGEVGEPKVVKELYRILEAKHP